MSVRYGYSYDREDYVGQFDSPEAALKVAIENSQGVASPPTEVYIGEVVQGDAQSGDHAESIIHAMRQRALVDVGDPARKYLKHVTPQQVKELDRALEQTITQWLSRNGLTPNFVRVKGIREYPVTFPLPASNGPAGAVTFQRGMQLSGVGSEGAD